MGKFSLFFVLYWNWLLMIVLVMELLRRRRLFNRRLSISLMGRSIRMLFSGGDGFDADMYFNRSMCGSLRYDVHCQKSE
jgi:hypothetical protein